MSEYLLAPISLTGFKSDSNSTLIDDDTILSCPNDYYTQPEASGCIAPSRILSGHFNGKKQMRKAFNDSRSAPYKPTVPYAQLIAQAIESKPEKKITLNEIYNYAMEEYQYFRTAGNGWKV
jgi:hypothetical protein